MSTAKRADVTLRRYGPDDLDAIFVLDTVCFAEPFRFDRRSMLRFAEADNAISIIAETAGGDLAGFVIVHVERVAEGRLGYVVTLDVAPSMRRSGIAGRLMSEGERLAGEARARWMGLHVYTGNERAIRFYEARGYRRSGLRRRFYGRGVVTSEDVDPEVPGTRDRETATAGPLDAYVYRKDLSETQPELFNT